MRKYQFLALAVATIVVAAPITVLADGIFESSYTETISFLNANPNQTVMTIAFDGDHYWSSDGGGPSGIRLSEYDDTGVLLNAYSPGIDFRSVFTVGGNTAPVYARGYASSQILVQTSPGVFGNDVVLSGGSLDIQSAVVFHTDGSNRFVAMKDGLVDTWNSDGSYAGSITLNGFGTMFGEGSYPMDRGIASFDGFLLTYSNGMLSAWDNAGDRVGTTQLIGAGTSFDSHFSFSYTNGMAFVVDNANGFWRGYRLSAIRELHIDIKFCSDPNAFNCKKDGVLPVTIFGMEDFLVEDIDPATLRLCTADMVCTEAPRDYSYADRGDPLLDLGAAMCAINPETGEEEDFLNEDTYVDLDAAFEASEVKAILGDYCDDAARGDVSEPLIIIGETYDGVLIYSVPQEDNTGIDRLVKKN